MAVSDVYRITQKYSLFGQDLSNVWHYRTSVANTSGTPADSLGSAFGPAIVTELLACMSEEVQFIEFEVINLRDPSDYGVYPQSNLFGDRDITGDNTLPSFVAVGFRASRPYPGTRYGYKRFAGGLESDVLGNLMSSTGVTLWNDLEAPLGANLTYNGGTWQPVIPSFIAWGGYGTNPPAYVANTWLLRNPTTQNSRKP